MVGGRDLAVRRLAREIQNHPAVGDANPLLEAAEEKQIVDAFLWLL